MSTLFKKYFSKVLTEEAGDIDMGGDQAALEASLPPEANDQINQELANMPQPTDNSEVIKLADKYSLKIHSVVLPILEKLHNELINGKFSALAPDFESLDKMCVDLATLAQQLKSNTRQAVIDDKKQSEKQMK